MNKNTAGLVSDEAMVMEAKKKLEASEDVPTPGACAEDSKNSRGLVPD